MKLNNYRNNNKIKIRYDERKKKSVKGRKEEINEK
jgi:hypothetical protein